MGIDKKRIYDIKIYHNPKCSKSREALSLLEQNNIKPKIIDYLDETLEREDLVYIISKLRINPRDMMRKNESIYKEHNLSDPLITDDELIDMIIRFPILMERPIVVNQDRAVIGRPPENILKIL